MNTRNEISLTPRITEIVTYYFANPSNTYTDLATHFNLSLARISQIMNHPKVLASYPILAKRRIKSMLPKAVERLDHLMNQSENYAVSEKVVSKILDSEKILEQSPRTIIHEIQMKSVKELQDIIQDAATLPQQVIEAEIVAETDKDA